MTTRNFLKKGILAAGALFLPLSVQAKIPLNDSDWFCMANQSVSVKVIKESLEERTKWFLVLLSRSLKQGKDPFNFRLWSPKTMEYTPLTFQQVKELWGFVDVNKHPYNLNTLVVRRDRNNIYILANNSKRVYHSYSPNPEAGQGYYPLKSWNFA